MSSRSERQSDLLHVNTQWNVLDIVYVLHCIKLWMTFNKDMAMTNEVSDKEATVLVNKNWMFYMLWTGICMVCSQVSNGFTTGGNIWKALPMNSFICYSTNVLTQGIRHLFM